MGQVPAANLFRMEKRCNNKIEDWVEALQKNDVKAFENLFEHFAKRLYYFAFGYLKCKEDAEEIVQDVFCKIWTNRNSLNPELSFKAYIFKIAYRRINELLVKAVQDKSFRHEIISTSLDFDNNLDERTDYHSLLELVDRTVSGLPPRQKEIFIKRKKEGLPVKEIALLLNISSKTVENHLNEAFKTIKKELSKEEIIAGLLFFVLFVEN